MKLAIVTAQTTCRVRRLARAPRPSGAGGRSPPLRTRPDRTPRRPSNTPHRPTEKSPSAGDLARAAGISPSAAAGKLQPIAKPVRRPGHAARSRPIRPIWHGLYPRKETAIDQPKRERYVGGGRHHRRRPRLRGVIAATARPPASPPAPRRYWRLRQGDAALPIAALIRATRRTRRTTRSGGYGVVSAMWQPRSPAIFGAALQRSAECPDCNISTGQVVSHFSAYGKPDGAGLMSSANGAYGEWG